MGQKKIHEDLRTNFFFQDLVKNINYKELSKCKIV